jgi:hypothetical protein
MKRWDAETETFMQEWTEQEVRTAIGVTPGCTVQDIEEYEPTGPHRWFAEAIAEIASLFTLGRMSEIWKDRPPYPNWRDYAPELTKHADEMTMTAKLPSGITLAQWYRENELLLQEDPTRQERNRVVAVALLPLFEEQPECWEATNWLDEDMSGTFLGYLGDWHARVPEKCRPFVRRIAREFGMEIEGDG